jgi:hypothetical protein
MALEMNARSGHSLLLPADDDYGYDSDGNRFDDCTSQDSCYSSGRSSCNARLAQNKLRALGPDIAALTQLRRLALQISRAPSAAELVRHAFALTALQHVSLDVHRPSRAAGDQGEQTCAAILSALPALTRLRASGTAFEVPRADAVWQDIAATLLPRLLRLSLGTWQEHAWPSSVQLLGEVLACATQLTQLSLGTADKDMQDVLAPYLVQLPLQCITPVHPPRRLASQLAGLVHLDLRLVRAIRTWGPMFELPDLFQHMRLTSLCFRRTVVSDVAPLGAQIGALTTLRRFAVDMPDHSDPYDDADVVDLAEQLTALHALFAPRLAGRGIDAGGAACLAAALQPLASALVQLEVARNDIFGQRRWIRDRSTATHPACVQCSTHGAAALLATLRRVWPRLPRSRCSGSRTRRSAATLQAR